MAPPASGDRLVEGIDSQALVSNPREVLAALPRITYDQDLLADKLESLGGQVSNGPDFTEYVVRDGRLVTGQNPQSTFATAHALVEALAAA